MIDSFVCLRKWTGVHSDVQQAAPGRHRTAGGVQERRPRPRRDQPRFRQDVRGLSGCVFSSSLLPCHRHSVRKKKIRMELASLGRTRSMGRFLARASGTPNLT